MSLPIDLGTANEELTTAVEAVQNWQATESVYAVADMLDALVVTYRIKLATCTAAQLHTLQTAIKQCELLRAALATDGELPTIL